MKKKKLLNLMLILVLLFSINPKQIQASSFAVNPTVIKDGDSFTGTLYNDTQVDWYTFTTQSGNIFYEINAISKSVPELRFEIYDINGELLYYECASETNSNLIAKKLVENSTYFIKVYNDSYRSVKSGEYTLQFNIIKDDIEDNQEKSTPLKLKTKYSGSFEVDEDVDWFKFSTDSSDSWYTISTTNQSIYGVCLSLYNSDGLEIGSTNVYKENMDSIVKKLNPQSTYYIKIDQSDKYNINIGKYTLTVTKQKDDGKDNLEEASSIKANKKYLKILDSKTDVDFFKFKPLKTKNYSIAFQNYSCNDTVLISLLDEDGATLNYNYAYTTKEYSTFSFKLIKGKTYYFKIEKQIYGSAVGKYRFIIK